MQLILLIDFFIRCINCRHGLTTALSQFGLVWLDFTHAPYSIVWPDRSNSPSRNLFLYGDSLKPELPEDPHSPYRDLIVLNFLLRYLPRYRIPQICTSAFGILPLMARINGFPDPYLPFRRSKEMQSLRRETHISLKTYKRDS